MTGAHCGKILFHLEKSSVVRRVASQRDRSGEDVDDDQTRKARNRWSIHVGVFERFDDQADIAMPDQTAILPEIPITVAPFLRATRAT